MNAVDTNVLLYVHDPRDARKQSIATDLMNSLPHKVILWQVACEYLAASRKLAVVGFTFEKACQNIEEFCRLFPLVVRAPSILTQACAMKLKHSVSYWDAMILAACQGAGVSTLYSEDINANMAPLGTLRVINPFEL